MHGPKSCCRSQLRRPWVTTWLLGGSSPSCALPMLQGKVELAAAPCSERVATAQVPLRAASACLRCFCRLELWQPVLMAASLWLPCLAARSQGGVCAGLWPPGRAHQLFVWACLAPTGMAVFTCEHQAAASMPCLSVQIKVIYLGQDFTGLSSEAGAVKWRL